MFGGGGGYDDDFWAGIPMELGPPAYAAPFPALAVPTPGPFLEYHPAFVPPPPPPPQPAQPAWTAAENKVFEAALVDFEEGRPDRWHRIAERIPGKTPWDVAEHYGRLEQDLRDIEAGVIELPEYADDCAARTPWGPSGASGADQEQQQQRHISFGGSRAKAEERKKGTPWTPEEHT
ncbi:hypothetical protein Taro_013160 [Colocasia esculenta]|uniref:Myb-like domain-containing protein n=1 Tax=Colocasia esculenta TaxID=4460 RepID=A0A843UFG9_COLES|nr:hypothetical protein [Colocasia esculenta]